MSDVYSDLSKQLTKNLDKKEKKQNGIYFTPPSTILHNIELIDMYMKKVTYVLEPSCGSCEYILKLKEHYPNINITGIEFNSTIYKSIQQL